MVYPTAQRLLDSRLRYQRKAAGTKAAGSTDAERWHPHSQPGYWRKKGESHLVWLNQFAKGLELLDDYDYEKLDAKGLSKQQAVYPDIPESQG